MADPAVFYIRFGKHVVVLFIHVDDTTITGSSTLLINEFKRRIEKDFEITDLGPISWLLGLAIVCNRAKWTLSISQKTYIESIIRHFNLEDAKELTVPIDSNIHLSKVDCPTSDEEKAEMKKIPYREAIGALNWVAIASWPDIVFVIGQLAQFLENLGWVHWEAAKQVIRYLKGTKELKLTYGENGKGGLVGYVDADGASQEHRHAISGYVVIIDGAVSWCSKKQELVTLSTMEAEYMSATHAAKELVWIWHLLEEVFHPLKQPIVLFLDNQSAIVLSHSQGQFHTWTKHIDTWYHFIKFCIEDGSIDLIYCPTEDMIADILTKSLPVIKAKYFTHDLGLLPVWGGVLEIKLYVLLYYMYLYCHSF